MKSRKKTPKTEKPDVKKGASPIHPDWHEALARRLSEGLEPGLALMSCRPQPAEGEPAHKPTVKEAAAECAAIIKQNGALSSRIAYLTAIDGTPAKASSAPREAQAHTKSNSVPTEEDSTEKEEAIKLCRDILNDDKNQSVDNRMKALDRLAKLRCWFEEKDDDQDIDPAKYAAYVNRERLRRFGGTASVKVVV